MRWAFKVAYLGGGFHGYQRQSGLRTVEGDLLEALQSRGIIDHPGHSRFQTASRTDKGVSALGNVIAFDSSFDPRKAISLVNSRLEDIWLHAYSEVPRAFNPRRAKERWYRYYLPGDLDMARLSEAASLFTGVHDFRAFAKSGGRGICHILAMDCHNLGKWIALDVRSDRFLWHMVRRIARGLEMYAGGTIRLSRLERALEGGGIDIEPAPPERLWLMDVTYDLNFRGFTSERLAGQLQRLGTTRELEASFLRKLAIRFTRRLPGPPPDQPQPEDE
ncbi:MAG: tRNA pseudouridine(38-40) synthase TruA [Thermoplasmata archaeon]